MFDKKSGYAVNKQDKDSILYISVTGPVRLTREDFPSEDEFLRWKRWSDGDYRTIEKEGRGYYDNSISLDDWLDVVGATLSVEEALALTLEEMEAQDNHARWCAELVARIKRSLTKKQFRRVWLYYVEKLSEREIAAIEGVGQQRISKSLIASKKIFEEIAAHLNRRG